MNIRVVTNDVPKIAYKDNGIIAVETPANVESLKTFIRDECTQLFNITTNFVHKLFNLAEVVDGCIGEDNGNLPFESILQAIADQLDYAFSKTKQIISTESGTGDLSLALNDVWYNFFMPLKCILQKLVYLDIWLSKQSRKQPLTENIVKLCKERKKNYAEIYPKIEEIILIQLNICRADNIHSCERVVHLIKFLEFSGTFGEFKKNLYRHTVEYYSNFGTIWIQEMDFSQYIHYVHTRYCNEYKLLRNFLDKKDVNTILDGVFCVLIADKRERLINQGNINEILTTKNYNLLHFVKTMFSRVKCENFYIKILVQSLVKIGLDLILYETSGIDHTLINRLMSFNVFMVGLKNYGFTSDYQFEDKLKKVWKNILGNINALRIVLCGLSLFFDHLLTFHQFFTSEEFVFSIDLLKYIKCRDDFEKLLRHVIGNKLIYIHNLNDNYKTLVNKLRSEFGLSFTHQIMMLLRDFNQSERLNQEFIKLTNQKYLTHETLVISHLVWFKNKVCDTLQLSFDQSVDNFHNSPVIEYEQAFTHFYQDKFKKRKLYYLPEYYIIHLSSTFMKKEITFQLSLVQSTLLLMFNTKKTVLLEDLIAELLKSWSFSFTSNLESLAKIHVENLVTMVPPLIFSTKEVNIQIKAGIRTKSGLLLGI